MFAEGGIAGGGYLLTLKLLMIPAPIAYEFSYSALKSEGPTVGNRYSRSGTEAIFYV